MAFYTSCRAEMVNHHSQRNKAFFSYVVATGALLAVVLSDAKFAPLIYAQTFIALGFSVIYFFHININGLIAR